MTCAASTRTRFLYTFAHSHCLTHIDLPEARKLCGVHDCPDCVARTPTLRQDVNHDAIRAAAVEQLLTQSKKKGRKAAMQVLRSGGMVEAHLYFDCPYLGSIAHLTPDCLPGDRLHLLCVPCCACSKVLPLR